MRIVHIHPKPIASFRFLNAASRRRVPNVERISVLRADCEGIPKDLDAIIATADLQGLEHWETANGQPPRLMGEVLPQLLTEDVLPDLSLSPSKTGVFLCGDLYTVPGATKRGGTGDVTSVWHAFNDQFRWVAGVAGNHDTYGPEKNATPSFSVGMDYLDVCSAECDGLTVAGIGGIIGNPDRNQRRTEDEFCECLSLLLDHTMSDVVLMHDGPNGPEQRQKGSPAIREVLNQYQPSLVIRGHAHWSTPLTQLEGGTQVLNVDSRIAVLTKAD